MMKMNKRFGAFLLVILMMAMAMVGCAEIEKGETNWKPTGGDPKVESQPTAAPEQIVTFGVYPNEEANTVISNVLKNNVQMDADTGIWSEYEKETAAEDGTVTVVVARYDLQTGFYHYKETVNGQVTVEERFVLENGKFFTVQPISWIKLEEKADSFVLISKDILDSGFPFLDVYSVSNWAESSIRDWLNGTDEYAKDGNAYAEKWNFISRAFTSAEISKMKLSTLTTEDSVYGVDGGADTQDLVYLLSGNEVATYFGDNLTAQSGGTPYALHKGLCAKGNQGIWWLRSPANNTFFQGVDRNGDVGGFESSDKDIGIRPVICVSKSAF